MAYALITKRLGSTIVVTMGVHQKEYAAIANRYNSEQDTHAHAAMQFASESGMRLDYPEWACGTISLSIQGVSDAMYAFVPGKALSYINTYKVDTFKILENGEIYR